MAQFAQNKFAHELKEVHFTDPLKKLESLKGNAEHEGEASVFVPDGLCASAVREAKAFLLEASEFVQELQVHRSHAHDEGAVGGVGRVLE